MALTNKLTAIADAIRAKTGRSALLNLSQMVSEIGTLKNPSGTLNVSANDTYDVTDYASAVVNVPGITPTGTLNITANDTYDVTQYAEAVVNVSGGGGSTVDLEKFKAVITDATTTTPLTFTATDTAGIMTIRNRGFAVVYPSSFTATFPDVTILRESAFYSSNVQEVTFAKKVSIEKTVFYGCNKLEQIDLQAGCSSIGESAFSGCSSLTTFPNLTNCTSISSTAFSNCSALTNAVIPDTVTSNYYQWFVGCSSMEEVDLGTGIPQISGSAYSPPFSNCPKLKRIILRRTSGVVTLQHANIFTTTATVPSTMRNFEGFYVPDDLVDTYKAATNWSTWASYILPLSDLPTS